jgi:hypothetical protein
LVNVLRFAMGGVIVRSADETNCRTFSTARRNKSAASVRDYCSGFYTPATRYDRNGYCRIREMRANTNLNNIFTLTTGVVRQIYK